MPELYQTNQLFGLSVACRMLLWLDNRRVVIFLLTFWSLLLHQVMPSCTSSEDCRISEECGSYSEETEETAEASINENVSKEAITCDATKGRICCPKISEKVGSRDILSPTFLPIPSEEEHAVPLIFGGKESPAGAFPFAAIIGVHRHEIQWAKVLAQEENIQWVCGGSLVNLWYVVTAAQCQEEEGPGISHVDIRDALENDQILKINPGDVIVHDRYKKKINHFENDIALIRLPKEVRITSLAQLAFLPFSQSSVSRQLGLRNLGVGLIGQNVTVVGPGYSKYKKDKSGRDTLEFLDDSEHKQNFIEVPVLHTTECRVRTGPDQFCTGGEEGKSACRRDAGSGALMASQTVLDTWYLIGIVSSVNRVCGSGHPTVFTMVPNHIIWIRKQLK